MHVLYVIDSLSASGAETSLASMARPLVAAGVRLDVAFLRERPGVGADLAEAGASLVSLAGRPGRASWARATSELLRSVRPDLVHTTLFEADLAGRLAGRRAGVPVVSTLANMAYGPEQMTNPDLRWWRVRSAQAVDALTARWVVRFHAISAAVAATMARRLVLPRDRIEVVPRGRDPQRLGRRTPERRERARARLGAGPEDLLVVAASRQEHQKGLDVLLEAWPQVRSSVPTARLVIAGRPGNQTPLLEEAARRLGPGAAVELLGARDDVHELLCAADAFVFPSRWEGFGSVLLEAMALEAPIVASDLPSIREVVGDTSCARLVAPAAPGPLARALAQTLRAPSESAGRARSARRRFVERFSSEAVAEAMVALYRRALA